MSARPALLPLDEHLCFSLYGASMAVGRIYKPLLDTLGLTYPQYLVLTALREGGAMSVGAVAERLLLESSTVTPLLKRLQAAGLVERERNPENERQVIVRLTPAGGALRERCACLGERLVAASGMTIAELGRLNGEARRLRDNLAKAQDEDRT
ncbi:transcriptional regulator [Aureimonas endophytica]|uniref:Transcriptional regulator n=1 Tax=Aureimonas endophytica TaxID=2027858 RepID=A0A916ZPC8_9HYPH|nr:MarR family transcriptional regulator [Aureimonas endophytica]GGE07643.1 transcriptional regulator [Aureimonas endophytica]